MKKKVSKRAPRQDPKKMSADQYARWAKGKSDAEIHKHYPHLITMLPSRPPVIGDITPEQQLLEKLPQPPPGYASEKEVLGWLREVGDVGGSAAIQLVFSSNRYWPWSALMRQQIWSSAIQIQNDVGARETAEAKKRNDEIREKAKATAGAGPKRWWKTRVA